jgi:predicted NBD/HSP70 family sugar kinase
MGRGITRLLRAAAAGAAVTALGVAGAATPASAAWHAAGSRAVLPALTGASRPVTADAAAALDNYAYIYLGEGLGCAVVTDGDVLRGHAGLAGEIAHLITVGVRGQAVPFTEVFVELGLRRSGSAAVNVDALLDAIAAGGARARQTRTALGQAISGVLAAVVALVDPEVIVIGDTWGRQPALAGARGHALRSLRSAIVALPRHS